MNIDGSLAGRSVLVTGAAGGIGTAAVQRIVANGGAVMAADIDEDAGREVVQHVVDKGGRAEFVRCDVTDSDQARAAVHATVDAFGRLDAAFNNAGWEGDPATVAEYDEAAWHKIVAVNLTGVFLCVRHELAVMLDAGGGAIVNTASISGVIANPHFGPYNATKHGVIGLTKAAALENATTGIRVNAVCPGFVDTPMVMRVGGTPGSEVRAAAEALHPMHRLATPHEVADAAIWLLSDQASFITGHSLMVDGGYTIV